MLERWSVGSKHPTSLFLRPCCWKAGASLGRAAVEQSWSTRSQQQGPHRPGLSSVPLGPCLGPWVCARGSPKAFLMSALVSDGAWQASCWPPGARTGQGGIEVG